MINKKIIEFATARDPDSALIAHLGAAVCGQGAARTASSDRLRLLLAGYLGAGNVGSDMRCNEIVRQIRHLLGPSQVSFSALAISDRFPPDALNEVKPLLFEGYIPDVVGQAVSEHDGVIACEGSMFKSHFSNVLSAMMAAALGMARMQDKLAVGYGAEVGAMDPDLERFVVEHAGRAPIFCRTAASRQTAADIGLNAQCGADTAWTFEAAPPSQGQALLRALGWDGVQPVVVVCPTNPFWWPVRASPTMALQMQRTGAHEALCYGSIFFHADSDDIRARYHRYVEALAVATDQIVGDRAAFPVLLAMEQVDGAACRDVAGRMAAPAPIVMGRDHAVGLIVALLRCAALLLSSRFHALIASIPGLVPSIGIASDERIRYLLTDSGGAERLINAGDPDLAERIIRKAEAMEPEAVAESCRRTVRRELQAMGEMGKAFVAEVQRVRPDFNAPDHGDHWRDHLPPLSPSIQAFL